MTCDCRFVADTCCPCLFCSGKHSCNAVPFFTMFLMQCWHGYLSRAMCKWSAYHPPDASRHCRSISCFTKIQTGLPFWCWLVQVVLEKRSLNGCCVVVFFTMPFTLLVPMVFQFLEHKQFSTLEVSPNGGPSGCTVASGVVGVVVVGICNHFQMRTSKCTCLIFGVSIGLDPARNAHKEFLIGQSSRSHATSPTISEWLLV